MPKKTSSWGQQEYIPAGNGDSSGEYADESGSNRHFTNFKKPEDAIDKTEKEEKIVEEPKAVGKEEKKDLSSLQVNKLDKKTRKEVIKYIYGYKDSPFYDKDRLIRSLRYYTGSFGDLSNLTDEDVSTWKN